MKNVQILAVAALSLALAGCPLQPQESSELQKARAKALETPIGTWAPLHHKEWKNGVELYTLDTRSGTVCSAFFSNDPSDKKDRITNQTACQNPAW